MPFPGLPLGPCASAALQRWTKNGNWNCTTHIDCASSLDTTRQARSRLHTCRVGLIHNQRPQRWHVQPTTLTLALTVPRQPHPRPSGAAQRGAHAPLLHRRSALPRPPRRLASQTAGSAPGPHSACGFVACTQLPQRWRSRRPPTFSSRRQATGCSLMLRGNCSARKARRWWRI